MPAKSGFCAPGPRSETFSAQPTQPSSLARPASVTIANPERNQFISAQCYIQRQLSEPCLHGRRIRSVLRDLRVYRMIAAIVGEMEFECAIAIDAGIGKAQRKRASGPACMQSHFPPARAVKPPFGSGNPRQIRQQPSRRQQGPASAAVEDNSICILTLSHTGQMQNPVHS
jgi:hypothetical protein